MIPPYSIITLKANKRYVQWYKWSDFSSTVQKNNATNSNVYAMNWINIIGGITERNNELKLNIDLFQTESQNNQILNLLNNL